MHAMLRGLLLCCFAVLLLVKAVQWWLVFLMWCFAP
jgi:hypothetical protein